VIFCAKNEDGIPTWKLVLEGKKTVTRRLKPMPIGKEFAIQPGRCKKAIAKAKVISCWDSKTFRDIAYDVLGLRNKYSPEISEKFHQREADKEGFKSIEGLMEWFFEHNINIKDTYRIEFELIKER